MGKLVDLAGEVGEAEPDIILLTETWLNPSLDNTYVNLPGFMVAARKDRTDTAGGGGGGGGGG